ncbi:MAG: two-component regulator propeller domain-containing protein, partial [Flavobacteriales bacterium]
MRRILLVLLLVAAAFQGYAQRYFFENIAVRDGLPASKVYAVLQDSTGLLWIGTEAGLASYDGNKVRTFGANDRLAPNGARSLFLDKDLRLWVGHLGGGVSLKEGNRFRTLQLGAEPPSRDITGIAQDSKGDVWIATFGEGAYRISQMAKDGTQEAD